MRTLIFCFILIQVSIARSAEDPKKRPAQSRSTSLPDGAGKALVTLAEQCEKATRELNGNINKGLGCTGKDVKAEAERREKAALDSVAAEFMGAMPEKSLDEPKGEAYVQAKTAALAKIKEPTEEIMDASGNKIRVSVMTPDQAIALHKNLLKNRYKELRLDFVKSGCVARAHTLGIDLEAQGIAVGKLWSKSGSLSIFGYGKLDAILPGHPNRDAVNWDFHVAPFVLVKKDSASPVEKWIIDPAFSRERPLPMDEYRTQLSSKPGWMSAPQITSRFVYTKDFITTNLQNHRNEDLKRYDADLQTTANDERNGTRGGSNNWRKVAPH